MSCYVIPESDSQWEDVDECIDLEDTEKEDSKVLKGLSEEVPEQTKVGGLVWDRKTVDIVCKNSVCTCSDRYMYMKNHNNIIILP